MHVLSKAALVAPVTPLTLAHVPHPIFTADALSAPSMAVGLSVRNLSVLLPDGRALVRDLNVELHAEKMGLVGRNGVGKSTLLKVLAGMLPPDTGRVVRGGRWAYVAQDVPLGVAQAAAAGRRLQVASVAGMGPVFDALARVEAGSVDAQDFALLEGQWDIASRLQLALDECGLGYLNPFDDATGLSGGELTRLALMGAFLSGADGLILDEPINHLDSAAREWVGQKLAHWRGAAMVVSHDRSLLHGMDRMLELSPNGLKCYTGNYSAYAAQRQLEMAAANAALQHAQAEKKAGLRALQKQQAAEQQRVARNSRAANGANQSGVVLGKQKDTAQASLGRAQQRRADAAALLVDAAREAWQRAPRARAVALAMPGSAVPAGKRVVALENAVLPFPHGAAALTFTLTGPVRLAIKGPNGSGKTTLMRMLAGDLAPLSGRCQTDVPAVWLDQHAQKLLPAHLSVLAQMQALSTPLAEGELRSQLAWLGLGPAQVHTPAAQLSGGERIKAALACALWAQRPAQLLLLDEPTNHLDLESTEALEQALADYPGALMVASHDMHFLEALKLTHLCEFDGHTWQLQALG